MHVLLLSAFDGVGACFLCIQYIPIHQSFDRFDGIPMDTPFIKMDELRIWNLWVTVQCSEISDTTWFSWSPQNPSGYSLRSSPPKKHNLQQPKFPHSNQIQLILNLVHPNFTGRWWLQTLRKTEKNCALDCDFHHVTISVLGGIKRWDCSSAFEIQEMLVEQFNHPRNGKNAGKKHPKNGRDVASYRLIDGNVVGLVTNHCSS